MPEYSLRLYSGVLSGTKWVADLTQQASDWHRSIRAQGGFWQGQYTLIGEQADLEWYFYETLGYHLEERSGAAITWEGMVYEMELFSSGLRMRRSLSLLGNAAKVRYTDAADNTVKETTFATQDSSIARYGRREEAWTMGKVSSASAIARRDTMQKEIAWPWARPVNFTFGNKPASLTVSVCGYIFTTNWKFVSVQDGATGNISAYINDIVATDCQFVSVGYARTNTLQVKRNTALAARAWDTLYGLTQEGDSSGNPWVIYADAGRRIFYEPVDTQPLYYIHKMKIVDRVGDSVAVNPWKVRPGVVRYAQYINRRNEPGSFLADSRDVYMDEVEVDASGKVSLRTALFAESEILDARQRELDREQQQQQQQGQGHNTTSPDSPEEPR